jgi:hypothetical protein
MSHYLLPVHLTRQNGETDAAYSRRLSRALRAAPDGSQAWADTAYALALTLPDAPECVALRRTYESSPFARQG